MASATVVHVPVAGANIYQAGPGFPVIAGTQQPWMVQYVPCAVQQPGSPSNPPEQNPQLGALRKFYKVEAKTLGAVQIMIGLTHIGFAVFSGIHLIFLILSGLFFITSGSLSVSAEKYKIRGLVQCSVGMNITSAVMSLIGFILYVIYLAIVYSDVSHLNNSSKYVGPGRYVVLILFTVLEFCITVSTAHFACQAAYCNHDQEAIVYVPQAVSGGEMIPASCPTAPPSYDAMELSSKRE